MDYATGIALRGCEELLRRYEGPWFKAAPWWRFWDREPDALFNECRRICYSVGDIVADVSVFNTIKEGFYVLGYASGTFPLEDYDSDWGVSHWDQNTELGRRRLQLLKDLIRLFKMQLAKGDAPASQS